MKILFLGRRKMSGQMFDLKYFTKISRELEGSDVKVIHPIGNCIFKARKANDFDYLRFESKAHYPTLVKCIAKKWYNLKYSLYFAKYLQVAKKYDALCVWGGNFCNLRGAMDAFKSLGKKVIIFENGPLPKTTSVDYGANFFNSVPREKGVYDTYKNSLEASSLSLQQRASVTKVEVENSPLPEKFIFVPFQVARDSQILLPSLSPWVRSVDEFFDIISQIRLPKGVFLVYKTHPSCKKIYNFPEKEGIIRSTEVTSTLLEKSLFTITVNSSVGLESLIKSRAVITAGNAFYSFDGNPNSRDARSIDELQNAVNDLLSGEFDSDFNGKFLSYIQNEVFVRGTHKDADEEHIKSVIKRILYLAS